MYCVQNAVNTISEIVGHNFHYKKAFFAINSLWLWNASRTLPIIRYFLRLDFEIVILAHWQSLEFLELELEDYSKKIFIDYPDYPNLIDSYLNDNLFSLSKRAFEFREHIKKEHKFFHSRSKNYDFIFSDSRYWIYSQKIPSFLLTHKVTNIEFKRHAGFQKLVNKAYRWMFENFTSVFIPDFKDWQTSLGWVVTHNRILKKINHFYIWPISSYTWGTKDTIVNKFDKEHIDYYFIISWYNWKNKKNFLNKLIEEAKELQWKKVFELWDMKQESVEVIEEHDITIYSHLKKQKRVKLFHNAWVIVSRLGYGTIMDIKLCKKKAILYPTAWKTEHEYLAQYADNSLFINWGDGSVPLVELVKRLSCVAW